MEMKLTDYESNLIKLYCKLYEQYEKDTGCIILHKEITELYIKFKNLIRLNI